MGPRKTGLPHLAHLLGTTSGKDFQAAIVKLNAKEMNALSEEEIRKAFTAVVDFCVHNRVALKSATARAADRVHTV